MRRAGALRLSLACLLAGLAALASQARASAGIEAGAAAENITPFTIIPGTTVVDPHADPAASNPDGLPGGLWDTLEPEPGFTSTGQVTPSGVWGEKFTDANGNARYDAGEDYVDDLVNTRLDVDSALKYDGVYMPGFGSNRIPRGAFDPLWARAVYMRDTSSGRAIAHATVDVLGRFSDWDDRIVAIAKRLEPSIDLDALVVSHTHNHESVDVHVGIWGQDLTYDGTYPKYERYMEHKIAQAVVEAAKAARPAQFRFGEIGPGEQFMTRANNVEVLDELQSRNSCRTPWVVDDELRVVNIGDAEGTIATIVNWGTHVESLEDDNLYLSSDFVHTVRSEIEAELGGVAMYVPSAQGAVEVVGDSCRARWQRTTFDGETFDVDSGGTPEVLKNIATDPRGARRRTYALGRVVGNAAIAALPEAWDPTATAIDGYAERDVFVPINNEGLGLLGAAGVIDKPSYVGGVSVAAETTGRAGLFTSPITGIDTKTTLYAWRIGTAAFVTAPGELFPELYYGLTGYNRTTAGADHYEYVSANPAALACSGRDFSYQGEGGANTGRPFEPGIRQAQTLRYGTEHNFIYGYTPDLLGYIVPGYDFAWFALPPADGVGLGAVHGAWGADEAPDPCRSHAPDLMFPGARYNSHYQETNSAGSMLAAGYACEMWKMLGLDPHTAAAEGGKACDEWDAWRNAVVAHVDLDERFLCDQLSDTDCVRHY